MYFKHKKTGNAFKCTDDIIDFLCVGEDGCDACPIWREAKVIRDSNCYKFAAENPEILARLAGLEIIEDNPPSQPQADSSPANAEPLEKVKEWLEERANEDMVNQPAHYTSGGIECADALDAMVSAYPDPNAAALAWQVGKYIWRHPLKWNPLEDLKKARWYLDRLIAHYEKKQEVSND